MLTTCQGCTRQRGGWDSNPRPTDRKSGTLPLRHRATDYNTNNIITSDNVCVCCIINYAGDGGDAAAKEEQPMMTTLDDIDVETNLALYQVS